MPKEKVRVKNKRIERAVLIVLGMNTVHGILADDASLSWGYYVGGVICGYLRSSVYDDKNLYFFMPMPAQRMHIGIA